MGGVFKAYGTPLMAVPLFKYLVKTLLSSDDNSPEVEQNIWRAWGKWGRMVNLLGGGVVDNRKLGIFYVALVQAVLLIGSYILVLTPHLEKALEDFHQRTVQRKSGVAPKRQWYGTSVYPPIGEALETVGMDDIGVCIACFQNTVTKYIVTRPIMDLCLAAEQKLVL